MFFFLFVLSLIEVFLLCLQVEVTGIDGLYDPKEKEQYIAHALGLIKPLAKGSTLKFLQCFKQVEEKKTYWQCGLLLLVWAWCIGQGWSASKIADFDVDQGPELRKWVVDLIAKDGPVPDPPRKEREQKGKKKGKKLKEPERVKVDEEAWSLLSTEEEEEEEATSKKRPKEVTPGQRKSPRTKRLKTN
jgi:hypothetical protein